MESINSWGLEFVETLPPEQPQPLVVHAISWVIAVVTMVSLALLHRCLAG